MMNLDKNVIEKLKVETKNSPTVNAVVHLLALRKRSRGTLTLNAITQRMRTEGFTYSAGEYREVLSTLATIGVGTPIVNRLGNCVGIKDIRVNLSELGKAAVDSKSAYPTTNKVVKAQPQALQGPLKAISQVTGLKINPIDSLEGSINGKPVVIKFPKGGLTAQELAALLNGLQHKKGA